MVLDEIDHLLPDTLPSSSTASNNANNVLSTLFSIALDPSSGLVLVGIANALDLTQRYSSLFSAASSYDSKQDDGHGAEQATRRDEIINEPELLHFRPFQSDEMVAIVKQRLATLHDLTPSDPASSSSSAQEEAASAKTAATAAPLPLPIITPAALELAAKKVAAVTGDLRSFLSLIRKAVEIFEYEQRKRLLDMQASSSGPVSPTKNTLAHRNRKRKLSMAAEGEQEEDEHEQEKMQDPLAKFDAKTAPKLTPAHILKATRVVSLVSSSSANKRSSSSAINGSGINSSAGSLSTSTSSSNNLLQSKISELNLHQRLALTSFLILLARRIASKVPTWSMIASSSTPTSTEAEQTIDVDAEASSIPNGGARLSELYSVYKSLLEKEDLLHPVSSSEFSDLLSGLHTRGLVGLERELSKFTSSTPSGASSSSTTLAPPMMRRTSSSSSVSSNGGSPASGRNSRSPSPNSKNTAASGAQAPLYLLYPFTSLQAVLSPPPSAAQAKTSSSPTEASSICSNLLMRESKRLLRIQKQNQQLEIQRKENELAPRVGFNGDGLDAHHNNARRVSYVGEKDRRGRAADGEGDDDENDEMELDHEKQSKLQEEEDEKKENDTTPSDW